LLIIIKVKAFPICWILRYLRPKVEW